MSSNLQTYLNQKCPGVFMEGHCQQVEDQVNVLRSMASFRNINNIVEIGFNAGHSSEVFLNANPRIKVTSFDDGSHDYYKYGQDYIHSKYPDRHTLIVGKSEHTIPHYTSANPEKKFDLIFIDGSSKYSEVKCDLLNCKDLAHKDTIVIMDDVVKNPKYRSVHNEGPTIVWKEGIKAGLVKEISSIEFVTNEGGRGMAWGKYIL